MIPGASIGRATKSRLDGKNKGGNGIFRNCQPGLAALPIMLAEVNVPSVKKP